MGVSRKFQTVHECGIRTLHVLCLLCVCVWEWESISFAVYLSKILASFPGLLTPAFVACSTIVLVLQATHIGVRRPGNEATQILPC